jgi:hypothetical protein
MSDGHDEHERLREAREGRAPWKKWGPYVSERQWGTVREDYSGSGDAWNYFTHDHARSRTYRWGEDGLAGICDDRQVLCFALALWNGRDPILKERLFGLTNSEGNHGEDVKEYYFYLDSTPTHSYMKYLYKYPQRAYPYDDLVSGNRERRRDQMEYELLDTGVFDDDRYFDVFVEYAKADAEDILIRITACNRGPEAATLHLLPTLWFRNTWFAGTAERPFLRASASDVIDAVHPLLGPRFLHIDGQADLLFTDNETNTERIAGTPNRPTFVKDGINDYVVRGHIAAVNPSGCGTKVAVHREVLIDPGETQTFRLRFSPALLRDPTSMSSRAGPPFGDFDAVMASRRRDADEFYASVIPDSLSEDAANVMRQALAGMLWSKQFYFYDIAQWLGERGDGHNGRTRNSSWRHMYNADIISMPDKWEYPWYAAWDLAFHILALTLVDEDFGKEQLDLMLRGTYLHPNGQLPAYEWNFGDVNPPVHAWSTIFTYRLEAMRRGRGDLDWLERSFHALLLNFTWWVNRKDRHGKNLFEGGFLGLDNIGVFDRSSPLPTGGYLEQADGTAWMALFCQNMLEISIELALTRPAYVRMCQKFVEHFLWIADSMYGQNGAFGMWDEEDGFFYDVLQLPDGRAQRLKIRSMVGLLPLCAVTVFNGELARRYPDVAQSIRDFIASHPDLVDSIHDPARPGCADRRMASILDERRLRRVLARLLDENEFLGPYGIRSLSRQHADHPFVFVVEGQEYRVPYLPAESDSGMFGGNSNWRGPVWMPVNGLIVRALLQYYSYYGNDFTIECPTGSGHRMNLYEVAQELVHRLSAIFLRDTSGRRPVYGGTGKFQTDPHWRDYVLFYEYFHGDNGAGLGASHQTGWTGTIARMMQLFATVPAEKVLELGTVGAALEQEAGRTDSRVIVPGELIAAGSARDTRPAR